MSRLAKQVTKEQVITALEYILDNNLDLKGATVHNLIYKGKAFPPKEVIRWAARLAKIPNWESMGLSGGEDANKPLKTMGFEIKTKNEISNKSSGLNLNVIPLLLKAYKNYRNSEDYVFRQNQFKVVPVLKEIIKATLKKETISNSDYTGFIQMFKYGCTDPIFDKYLKSNVPNETEFKRLHQLAYEANEFGYTGAGLNSVTSLTDDALQSVKNFLLKAFDTTNVAEAILLCRDFEALNVSQIRSGIFSPWLYYINPSLFPILNNSHNDFRKLLNLSNVYSETLEAFQFLKKEFGEEDLGMVDFFAYKINKYLPQQASTPSIKIAMKHSLNQILYGPPGTGKTYYTINRALEIINDEEVNKLDWTDRKAVKDLYDVKLKSGQIVFTTFHQSLGYEDFVEGIKPQAPIIEGGNISYEIEPGIFKAICETAKTPTDLKTQNEDAFEKVKFFKMSIGGKNRPDIHDWCLENNVVGLGYGNDEDFSEINKIKDWNKYRDAFKNHYPNLVNESKYPIQAMFIFQKMQIGDIVVVTKGNHVIDAIGKIVSEYYHDDDTPNDYYQFRKVEWLAKNINQSPSIFFNKNISQQTIYEFFDADVKKEAFKAFFEQKPLSQKNYVLIIDEINRGNVSAIFGELITLIEESKRAGASEALELTLPYSKEKFSVPSNLYIIGTMNTADRSVEALDTALRRRFAFEEMMPAPLKITTEGALANGIIDGIDLAKVLTKINERIEVLLDADHQIGHSYLINVASKQDLASAFNNCIIPLLKEYFYHDDEKIALVLGGGFVYVKKELENVNALFPQMEGLEIHSINAKSKFGLKKIDSDSIVEALNTLLASA